MSISCVVIFWIITIVFLWEHGFVGGTPHVGIVGGDAYLNWTIGNLADDVFRFIRNPADNASLMVFFINKTVPYIIDNRTKFTGDISQGIVSFTLSDVKLSDAGRYTFTRSNGNNGTLILGGQVLIVAETPDTPVIKSLSVAAVVDKKYKLNCSTQSRSAPLDHNLTMYSYWKQNGVNISLESSYIVNGTILTINNLSRMDNGEKFTCHAFENQRVVSAESSAFVLKVLYGPDSVQVTPSGMLNVTEGGNMNLTCTAECNPSCSTYRWSKDSLLTIVGSSQSYWIPEVRRNHSGIYICSVTNTNISKSATAQITVSVNYGPDDVIITLSPNQTFEPEELSSLSVNCSAYCYPFCQYRWTGPGNYSYGNTGVLSIQKITRNQTGVFTCTATNPELINKSATANISVAVLYGPDNVQVTPSGILNVTEGGNMNLTCTAECNPSCSTYRWSKDHLLTIVGSSQSYWIPEVRRNHSGIYTCTVTNTNISKSATAQITVNVNYGPDDGSITLSPNQTKETVELSPIYVNCSADCYPVCQYRWTGPGNYLSGNTGMLSIPQIMRNQTGVFTCTARNPEINNKFATVNISVTVLYGPDDGSIILTSNHTLERVEFSPLNVTSSADCFPLCQYKWTGPGNYSYGNTEVLSIPHIMRDQAGVFTCTAMNLRIQNRSTTSNISVIVLYPPVVSINSQNGTYNDTITALTCSANGVPGQYVFTLTHRSLFTGTMIRHPSFDNVSIGVIRYRFSSFMDTGIYTCTVNNGIADYRDGSVNKSVSETVWIKGPPIVTSSITSFHAEKGQSGRLAIEFYNSLLDPNVTWYREKNQSLEKINSSDKYSISISNVSVTLNFYSVSIQQPGFIAALEIVNVTQNDFVSYQVNVHNSAGVMSPRVLVLRPRGPPDVPHDVHIVPSSITTSSVGMEWLSGFYGGSNQTFAIEYREYGDTSWTNASEDVFGGMTQDEYFNTTIGGLLQETMYLFRMYAWNSYNRSEYSAVINATTAAESKREKFLGNGSDKVIIGSAVGAVVLLVFAVVIGVAIFKRRRMPKLHADGLVDNPVYDSTESQTGFINNSIATGDEYAVVVKPKKQSSEKENLANLYAQVDKTNKTGKKGEIYENVKLVGTNSNPGDMHEHLRSAKAGATVDNVYENPETSAPKDLMVNTDGLLYADLDLNPPMTWKGKPVIIGKENRTEYAEIAYVKREE